MVTLATNQKETSTKFDRNSGLSFPESKTINNMITMASVLPVTDAHKSLR
ncbi:hypothetical protein D082_09700 [Synechocystis sp. PCC 6714]|nr:hypothetical protein D082_09700 [Synechocystis sp. PCC 6714]